MTKATPVNFRLPDATFGSLDRLSVPHEGNRTAALRDAVSGWEMVLREAAEKNAAELSEDEWRRLAHLNDPGPSESDLGPGFVLDWSRRLALELAGQWDGKVFIEVLHGADRSADLALAEKISDWGAVRGYALWAALRVFWLRWDQPQPKQWWMQNMECIAKPAPP